MTDPDGVSNVYTYDANGDLISYKDRASTTTSFTFEPAVPRHLKSIIDPLGRAPVRNDYDTSGRPLKPSRAGQVADSRDNLKSQAFAQKSDVRKLLYLLRLLEAAIGIEPMNKGFADL